METAVAWSKVQRKLFALTLLAFLVSLSFGCGMNDSASNGGGDEGGEEYPAREINFVVPFSAGGNYDQWARLLAPHIEENLPGDVTVVVENRPGAGGLTAANELYAAEPDGSQIQIFNMIGLAAGEIAGDTNFDLNQFTYLAQVSNEPQVLGVNPDSGINTVEDLRNNEPVTQAIAGFTSSDGVATVILYEALDIEYRAVLHEGGTEADLSVIRGDNDATLRSVGGLLANFQSGELKPILVFDTELPPEGDPGHEELQEAQTLEDIGLSDLQDAFQAPRMLATAPDTPDDIVQMLDQAIQASLEDPELQQQVEEAELLADPLDAAEATEAVESLLDSLGEYEEPLREAIESER